MLKRDGQQRWEVRRSFFLLADLRFQLLPPKPLASRDGRTPTAGRILILIRVIAIVDRSKKVRARACDKKLCCLDIQRTLYSERWLQSLLPRRLQGRGTPSPLRSQNGSSMPFPPWASPA